MSTFDPAADLLSEIDAAFAGRVRPRGCFGVDAPLGDEAAAAAKAFSGIDWKELTVEKFEAISQKYTDNFLSFLSHEAFHYYLPAYLKMVVQSDQARMNLLGALVHSLTLTDDPRKPSLRDWQLARLDRFSVREARVVCSFLSWAAKEHGIASGKVGPDGAWDDFAAPISFWTRKAGFSQ